MKTASWVIVETATSRAVLETYSERLKDAINQDKYTAIPILEYLQRLNQSIRETAA
jgi:hypothetical protein